jgi:hypothetical protein
VASPRCIAVNSITPTDNTASGVYAVFDITRRKVSGVFHYDGAELRRFGSFDI